jgi:pimeloyl-ACP methyl ester carboxylesterase
LGLHSEQAGPVWYVVCLPVHQSTMSDRSQDPTIVLVHGAWADSSCWHRVVRRLQRLHFQVTCAPLPLTSLPDDVSALTRTLERTTAPVVLAGHAYAGAVIGATGDDRVTSLVYIAALAPDKGETVAEVFYRDERHPDAPTLAPDQHGLLWMPEEGFHRAVAPQALPDQRSLMAAAQRPIALKCIEEPAPSPTWKTHPSWFLVAEEDRMINPKTQHFMAQRMRARIRSHPVDHSPMLSAPDLVTNVILEAARDSCGA